MAFSKIPFCYLKSYYPDFILISYAEAVYVFMQQNVKDIGVVHLWVGFLYLIQGPFVYDDSICVKRVECSKIGIFVRAKIAKPKKKPCLVISGIIPDRASS